MSSFEGSGSEWLPGVPKVPRWRARGDGEAFLLGREGEEEEGALVIATFRSERHTVQTHPRQRK